MAEISNRDIVLALIRGLKQTLKLLEQLLKG